MSFKNYFDKCCRAPLNKRSSTLLKRGLGVLLVLHWTLCDGSFSSQPLPHYVVWYVQENSPLTPTALYILFFFVNTSCNVNIWGFSSLAYGIILIVAIAYYVHCMYVVLLVLFIFIPIGNLCLVWSSICPVQYYFRPCHHSSLFVGWQGLSNGSRYCFCSSALVWPCGRNEIKLRVNQQLTYLPTVRDLVANRPCAEVVTIIIKHNLYAGSHLPPHLTENFKLLSVYATVCTSRREWNWALVCQHGERR